MRRSASSRCAAHRQRRLPRRPRPRTRPGSSCAAGCSGERRGGAAVARTGRGTRPARRGAAGSAHGGAAVPPPRRACRGRLRSARSSADSRGRARAASSPRAAAGARRGHPESGAARRRVCRAPPAAMRISKFSRRSSMLGLATKTPLWGRLVKSPERCRSAKASRTGVELTPNRSAISVWRRCVPPGSSPLLISRLSSPGEPFRERPVGLILGRRATAHLGLLMWVAAPRAAPPSRPGARCAWSSASRGRGSRCSRAASTSRGCRRR